MVNKIDSGPSWETPQDSNAVAGYLKWERTDNGNDGGGGCAYVNGRDAKAGFACYLQASESNGGANSYFSEDGSGGDIHPISEGQYNQLLGDTSNDTSSTATATSSTVTASAGLYSGSAPITRSGPIPDRSTCATGVMVSLSGDTNCAFAKNVFSVVQQGFNATGHVPATVVAYGPASKQNVRMNCEVLEPANEVQCTGSSAGVGVTLSVWTVEGKSPPLGTPSSPVPSAYPPAGSTGNTGSAGSTVSGNTGPSGNTGGSTGGGNTGASSAPKPSGGAGLNSSAFCQQNPGAC